MDKETLINKFSESLVENNGIFFIGSGISAPSGFPTWKELLEPLIKDLNIKITKNDDLTEIAQYVVNIYTGNKGPLLSDVINAFKKDKEINNYHEIIIRTKLKKIWTTNFDLLLEKAFNNYSIDYIVKTNDSDFLKNNKTEQVQIIKMHGCIDKNPDDIVFTQEDYEDFFIKKPAIAGQLRTDLLNNSFLFIGYSFGDSNLKNILIETRRLSKKLTRQHFLIQLKDNDNIEKQKLWCNNLKRFGIESVLINNYSELETILDKIANKSKGKSIYITGSHLKEKDDFAKELGAKLAEMQDVKILDGQSTGISRTCISNYSQTCLTKNFDIHNRLVLFPNPYAINKDFSNKKELIPILKKWRNPIFRNCQLIIVFDGKLGTKAELELAEQFRTYILPIPLKKDDLAFKILQNNKDTIDSEYYKKAIECKLEVSDVINFIKKIFKS